MKTTEEIAALNIPLIIREDVSRSDTPQQEPAPPIPDAFEVASVVYEPLLDIFDASSRGRNKTNSKRNKYLRNDAVHLRLPDKGWVQGGTEFLIAAVEHFAKDIRANLITLRADDFIDLTEHFMGLIPKVARSDDGDDDNDGDKEDEPPKNTQVRL